MKRPCFWPAVALFCICGCAWWPQGTVLQSPEICDEKADVPVVGDWAVPNGLEPIRVEGVGLVTGLNGTGCDPKPSSHRQMLLSEMRVRGVENPEAVLASPDTALVIVRGYLTPGVQKGEHFDVEVRLPAQSEATSLRGAWLLETAMKEFAVLGDNRLHTGHKLGRAAGPVMVDPMAERRDDKVLQGRGWILGGGVALKSRSLGLVLKPDHQSVLNASRLEAAVNRRFFTYEHGNKVGVAKAKTDEFVELKVHPRYRHNIQRYVRVVRAVPLRDSELLRQERLDQLEKQLLDPITSDRAALRLEAIGRDAVEVLRKGLASEEPEIRFYAAEALAYLDQTEAAEPLAQLARDVPAFRVFALTALSAMDQAVAADQLRQLLASPSAETRYGAFRALWAMKHSDPIVVGENMKGQFSYHVLDVAGPPMIHVTRSFRPEVVVFGRDQQLRTPFTLEAGNQIMVVADSPDHVAVSRFAVGKQDQRRIVSAKVDDIIRAIVELGGTYPDVVQALQDAHAQGALPGRLAVDALPQAGRKYERVVHSGQSDQKQSDQLSTSRRGGTLFPRLGSLFRNQRSAKGEEPHTDRSTEELSAASPQAEQRVF